MQTDTLPATPDEYRRRYEELKRTAQDKQKRRESLSQHRNPAALPPELIIVKETIPGGWYWTVRLSRWQSLRILNPEGRSAVSALFWNSADPSERYNAGDTLKIQWNAVVTRGSVLFSDMGRVLMSVTDDTCGAHDGLVGGSNPQSNARKYRRADIRNSRDNFRLAAAKNGLGVRDVPPCITFFAPVSVDDEGRFIWKYNALRPGQYVDLRAEMDVLIALSNCPHPLDPNSDYAPAPVQAIVWNSPKPAPNDLCRNATDEAVRAFENTDALFR